jgi:pantetheine-phosphate adenylyltransferase
VLLFYPGSFDPLHFGHLDIIQRASRIAPLIIGIGANPSKEPLLSPEQRAQALRAETALLGEVRVELYHGSTMEAAHRHGAILIRGIRNTSDLEFEGSMAAIHRAHGLETLFLLSESRYSQISSRAVRLALSAGLNVNDMVPPAVVKLLERRPTP